MHAAVLVWCSLSTLQYTYEYVNTTSDGAVQAKVTCNGDGLTYFEVSQTLRQDDRTVLDNECKYYNLTGDSASFLNFKLEFYRRRLFVDVTTVPKMLSVNEMQQRRITVPVGHTSCSDGGDIRCIPGPCRIWEYDYQAPRVDNTNVSPQDDDSEFIEQVGRPVCGPLFGVQASSFGGVEPTIVPESVDSATIKMFPSLQEGNAPNLYNAAEFRVPVPPNNSINLNPPHYYKSTLSHKYGSMDASDLNTVTCEGKAAPYLAPTLTTRWGFKSGDRSTRHLGLFDTDAAMTELGPSLKSLATGKGVTELNYVNTIPQLMESSLVPLNKSNVSANTQEQRQLKYEETCDLSQCSWLPVLLDFKHAAKGAEAIMLENCLMAEILAMYRNITDSVCNSSAIGSKPIFCSGFNASDRDKVSNPSNFLPTHCYAPANTAPNTTTGSSTPCKTFPYTNVFGFGTPEYENCAVEGSTIKVSGSTCVNNVNFWLNPQTVPDGAIGLSELYLTKEGDGRTDCKNKGGPNFKNMSDVFFRWPFGYGLNSYVDPSPGAGYYYSPGGFSSARYGIPNLPQTSTLPEPSDRILVPFKCGPRAWSDATNMFANQISKEKKKMTRDFSHCFLNWQTLYSTQGKKESSSVFANLLTCLLDYGLIRTTRSKSSTKTESSIDQTSNNAKMYILSILTYIFGTPPFNDEFKTGNKGPYARDNFFPEDVDISKLFDTSKFEDPSLLSNYKFALHSFSESENPVPQTYVPIKQAIVDDRKYHATSPMKLNASFLNNAQFSESHACNCGNSPITYAFEGIPLDYQPDIFARGNKFDAGPATTWLMHLGYAWAKTTMPDELSIGLYMPGNPSYTDNFTIVERDFLQPTNGNTVATLATDYYLGSSAPLAPHLINELQFADVATESRASIPNRYNLTTTYRGAGQRFKVSKVQFKYGSCLRFPYGQVSMMELDKEARAYFYGTPTTYENEQPDVDRYSILTESLLGYCENVADGPNTPPQYAYCFGDPLHVKRTTFCKNPATQYNIVGRAINERQIANICNKQYKYCFYVPGDPMYPTLNNILINSEISDMSGYTILVSPFNFTIARFLLGPDTYYYPVGGSSVNVSDTTSSILKQSNSFVRDIYGMALLTAAEFNVLSGNWTDTPIETAVALVTSIVAKINQTQVNASDANTLYTWPVLQLHDTLAVNSGFVYPPLLETNIKIAHNNLTIRSATSTGFIRFAQVSSEPDTSITCNRFLVSAAMFTLENTFVNQANCKTTQEIDNAVVLFGGGDVSNSRLTLGSSNAITPVVFAGDDSLMFQQLVGASVDASNVRIEYTNLDFQFAVAAARTFTTSNITLLFPPTTAPNYTVTSVVQPRQFAKQGIGITAVNVNLRIINITKYTAVFSNSVLQAEFPLRNVSQHVNYVLFIILVSSLTYFVVSVAVHAWKIMHEARIQETTTSDFVIRNQFGTTVATNLHTNEHWNAHNLRSRIVARKLGNGDAGAPEELQTYLFNSHFKIE